MSTDGTPPDAPVVPVDVSIDLAGTSIDLRDGGRGGGGGDGPGPAVDLRAVPGGERAALEAVLMVVEAPVEADALAAALDLPPARVARLLAELAEDYRSAGRGFELRSTAGGWRVYSRADLAPVVRRFVLEGSSARLSRAALETLAVIAYRQPVTRGRVSAVRGVDVDGVVRTLVARGLVAEAGREEGSGAVLYRTTPVFLESTGLAGLADLPPLAPHLPTDDELDELDDMIGAQP